MDEIQKTLLEEVAGLMRCRQGHIISAQTDSCQEEIRRRISTLSARMTAAESTLK